MSHVMGVAVDDRSVIRRKLQGGVKTERRIVVIIPAYNEAASIQATVDSVHAQTV